MARNVLEIVVRAKDDASAKVKSMGEKIKGSVKNLITLPHVIMAGVVGKAISSVIKAYGKQEEAIAKLNAALRASGLFTEKASKSLQEYAKALQATTKFGDEEILSAEAMLATFKLTESTIKEIIPLVLDMAAATGQDLQSAAILMGKAAVGVTGTLSRYGVIVDKADLKSRGLAAVLDEVRKNFGGTAEAVAKKGIGPLKQFGNLVGDVSESIGAKLIVGLNSAIETLKGMLPPIEAIGKVAGSVMGSMISGLADLIKVLTKLPIIIASITTAIILLSKQIGAFILSLSATQVVLATFTAALLTIEAIGNRWSKTIDEQIAKTDSWNKTLKKIPALLKDEGVETEKVINLLKFERWLRKEGTKAALEERDKVRQSIKEIVDAREKAISEERRLSQEKIKLAEEEAKKKMEFEDALYEHRVKTGEITLEKQIEDTEMSLELLRGKNEMETIEYVTLLDRLWELQQEADARSEEAEKKKFDVSKMRAKELATLNADIASGLSTNFVNAFKMMASGEKNYASVHKSLMNGILSTTTGVIEKIMTKKIEEAILTKAVSTTEAGSKSVSAYAGIPFVGLALGLAAAALATNAISKFAEGGIVTKPTLGLVGEAGSEAIIPLSKMNKGMGVHIEKIIIQFPNVTTFQDWLDADPTRIKDITELKIMEALEALSREGKFVPGV